MDVPIPLSYATIVNAITMAVHCIQVETNCNHKDSNDNGHDNTDNLHRQCDPVIIISDYKVKTSIIGQREPIC